jgi:RNA polymerase sigma-70 factor (ECF subfamily)
MTARTNPGDEELLRQMMAGDEQAFVTLYRRRQGDIYRYTLHMSGSAALAEEVTQEVFVALIREPAQYDAARGPLSAYLYGIARNRVLQRLEQDRNYVPLEEEGLDRASPPDTGYQDPVLREMLRRETVEAVRRAVLALPPNYREVVVLCDLQEMSYEEAARLLTCAVGTVRSRLHRARALLATKLRARLRSTGAVGCLV